MSKDISDGVYFFHRSFLIEVSNTWLDKNTISPSGELLMRMVMEFQTNSVSGNEIITCDRTMAELGKSKYIY